MGDAVCSIDAAYLHCNVIYPGLQIQEHEVHDFLYRNYSGAEMLMRQEVSLEFSEIPEGNVSVPISHMK